MQTREAIRTMQLARSWVDAVRARLDAMPPGEAMEMLEPYDLMYRVGHRRPMPRELADRHILRAFEARLTGDETVNEYHLYRLVRDQLKRKNPVYYDRPLQWYIATLDRWYETMRCPGGADTLPDLDIIEILGLLMSEDLTPFTPGDQDRFKRQLIECHSRLFDNPDRRTPAERHALAYLRAWSRRFGP